MKDVVFVLVPGSFATPIFYEKVTPLLRSKGYTVQEVPLLSANDGTRQPPATMEDDAAHIRAAVMDILSTGKDVVLAMHSYSGIPGSEAVKGLTPSSSECIPSENSGHVIGLVYITSFIASPGQSVRSIMYPKHMPEDLYNAPLDIYLPWNPAFGPAVFNDLPQTEEGQAEVQRYAASMTSHSSVSYSGQATYEAWRDVPNMTYLLGTIDLIIPPEVQHQMVDRVVEESKGKLRKVVMEGAGHASNVTRPEVVVEELIRVAKID